ncbi:hypothetical protein [Paucibacter sp. DJ2R-2]|uniref:hypothetical protein n=1 Tax=Paucibacter sp. DJ2R-2 TaxID=2893558 RepID=UPI0021E47C1E|nr:hypothetical protein [Paucibacter sp. DJ2R-2]MCV2437773.1 hypothetical protein [Paucibacter sp. DJ2R-2]
MQQKNRLNGPAAHMKGAVDGRSRVRLAALQGQQARRFQIIGPAELEFLQIPPGEVFEIELPIFTWHQFGEKMASGDAKSEPIQTWCIGRVEIEFGSAKTRIAQSGLMRVPEFLVEPFIC